MLLKWIPSHKNIKGNEKADNLAKCATLLPQASINPIPDVRSFLKQAEDEHRREIAEWWRTNRSLNSIYYNDVVDINIPNIHNNLTFQESRWLTWIRSNSMPLNAHLYQMQIKSSNLCKCSDEFNQSIETINHFLFQCPRFEHLRNDLIRPHGPYQQTNERIKLMNTKEGRLGILQFIHKSKRFKERS